MMPDIPLETIIAILCGLPCDGIDPLAIAQINADIQL